MDIENDSNRFMRSLPPGPLVRHLGALHALATWLPHTESPEVVRETMHYHLRQIAVYTADPEWVARRYPSPFTNRPEPVEQVDLSKVGDTLRQAAKTFSANIQDLQARLRDRREARDAALSPEQRDKVSKARYDRAVAAERRAGRSFVASEVARVRRELGLPS